MGIMFHYICQEQSYQYPIYRRQRKGSCGEPIYFYPQGYLFLIYSRGFVVGSCHIDGWPFFLYFLFHWILAEITRGCLVKENACF